MSVHPSLLPAAPPDLGMPLTVVVDHATGEAAATALLNRVKLDGSGRDGPSAEMVTVAAVREGVDAAGHAERGVAGAVGPGDRGGV